MESTPRVILSTQPEKFVDTGYPLFMGHCFGQGYHSDSLLQIVPVITQKIASNEESSAQQVLQASWSLPYTELHAEINAIGLFTHPPIIASEGKKSDVSNIYTEFYSSIVKNTRVAVALSDTQDTIKESHIALSQHFSQLGVVYVSPSAYILRLLNAVDISTALIGAQGYSEEEARFIKRYGICNFDMDSLRKTNKYRIKMPTNFPKQILLVVDFAVLGSPHFSSTQKPLPGGLDYFALIDIIQQVCETQVVCGMHFSGLDASQSTEKDRITVADLVAKSLVYGGRSQHRDIT